ncbi:MAG TPA: class I tRNA ligase family protein, partial [Thermoleophilia bacterium]|nr:class I tRNA ligase family protein [Thermoleophilia bacterium]
RETDTMDTFVCSSWYHFRFPSPHDEEAAFDREKVDYWLPVDLYVGGAEHAVMHLLYARFFCKVMQDAGYVDFGEPYATLRNQGMILAEDGQKMSKSKGNVVTPDSVVERYGADSLRLYELFIAPFEQAVAWNDRGVQGCSRFLTRFWSFALAVAELPVAAADAGAGDGGASVAVGGTDGDGAGADVRRVLRTLHKTVRKVTGDLQDFRFNTAVAALMEGQNDLLEVWNERRDAVPSGDWRAVADTFTLLLAPLTPHISEELWHRLGHDGSVLDAAWPAWDERLAADEVVTVVVQVNGKLRDRLEVPVDAARDDVLSLARAAQNTGRFLEGKELVKEVYVPGKLVNFVVR